LAAGAPIADEAGMRHTWFALVALLALANIARADPPGMTEPAAPPPPDAGSYRFQIAAADLTAIGLGLLGRAGDSDAFTGAALGMYIAGGPIVHLIHHHTGRAAASAALRIGLPIVAGVVGSAIDRSQCTGDCGDVPGLGGALIGVTLGAVTASAIDIGYLSRGEDTKPLGPADRPLATLPPSAPLESVEPRTVRVGLAFAF
jgi:hypothetical protein